MVLTYVRAAAGRCVHVCVCINHAAGQGRPGAHALHASKGPSGAAVGWARARARRGARCRINSHEGVVAGCRHLTR